MTCACGLELTVLVEPVSRRLAARGETVATAESCTGGLLATALTTLAGSSRVFRGGVTAYANEAKVDLLGVDAQLIARHGAVSAEVAASMASGASRRLGATWGISLTGIAGPDGGTIDKPVGTVFLGLAGPAGVRTERLQLAGDRSAVRVGAARAALSILIEVLGT